jgi:DNA-binding CsgD family transcriptional regulator/PAS domain-containing protein
MMYSDFTLFCATVGVGWLQKMDDKCARLLDLVSDIYDCALDPSGWEPTLTKINDALGAAYTAISMADTAYMKPMLVVNSPWDQAQLTLLHREFAAHEVPGAREVITGDVDSPGSTLAMISEAEFQTCRFYREWVAPQGLRDGCVLKFAHTAERLGIMSVVTRANRDVISAEERQFMALLSPHLRRAALIGDLLQNKRVETQIYRSALDRLSVAVYLVNAQSKILYQNQSAEKLLTQQSHFTAKAGVLAARHPVTAAPLADAIRRASGEELGNRGIGIPVSLGSAPSAVAYVLPLNAGAVRSALQPATAAVFVSIAGILPAELESVFGTLYDLTPAEARLMHKIGSGMTVTAAAEALSVSEATVKTHLQRVFRKVDVSRQTDLVALIESLRPPIA